MAVVARGFLRRSGTQLFFFTNHYIRSSRAVCCVCRLHTSSVFSGLEEFFPPGVLDKGELAPESVKTGRRWRAGELRGKSSEDLHKLWYVLLKERNMLNTLMHDAKRNSVPMPSPERYYKVQKSMATIKLVISERERVVRQLEKQTWAFDTEETEESSEELKQEPSEEVVKEVLVAEGLLDKEQTKEGMFARFRQKVLSRVWRPVL